MKLLTRYSPSGRMGAITIATIILVGILSGLLVRAAWAGTPLSMAGYLDFSFGSGQGDKITGEKPESKLWWHDGFWWGSLYNPDAGENQIYRLDLGNHNWVTTGVAIDDRSNSRADVLWDEGSQKLYVVSHIKIQNPSAITSESNWGRLYRYSYDSNNLSYDLDNGFPVTVNQDKTESLVLDKDSTGRLWVTYVSRIAGASTYQVYVNASEGGDDDWGTPFTLPFPEATVAMDDISSVIAFTDASGPKIGVMWSNQLDGKFYFAVHPDGAAVSSGWTLETIDIYYPSDDHINLATTANGDILAAVKLSTTTPTNPLLGVIARDRDGNYSFHPLTDVTGSDTRPIIVLHESSNQAYVFATNREIGGRICYWSATITASLSDMDFPNDDCVSTGEGGAPIFIGDDEYSNINNATSTKQNTNDTTGIAVLASDEDNGDVYLHNVLGGSIPSPTPTPVETATSTPSPEPTATATSTSTPVPSPTATGEPTATSTPELTPATPTATPTVTPTLPPRGPIKAYMPIVRR